MLIGWIQVTQEHKNTKKKIISRRIIIRKRLLNNKVTLIYHGIRKFKC